MRTTVHGVIGPDHPALAGHFPGNPVVPGVVLLTELLRAVEERLHWTSDAVMVTSVKFAQLLRPCEPFTLLLDRLSEGEVSFAVMRENVRIAAGTLRRDGQVIGQGRP